MDNFTDILTLSIPEPAAFFADINGKSVKNGNPSGRYSATKRDNGMGHKRSNDGFT